MRQYFSRLFSKHGVSILAGVGILLLYTVFFAVGVGCPIKYISGISCAGCGMTRACISALRLDLSSAFAYHPLWIGLPVVLPLLAFFKIKKMNKAFYSLIFAAAGIMLAVYIYRLVLTDSSVVVFSPRSGAIYRLFEKLMKIFTPS